MAVMTDQQRAEVTARLMQEISTQGETCDQVKAVVRTLVNDLDAFFNANASTINSAITQPARSLPTPIKARAGQLVLRERYLKGV